jgi:hypothetical protein
MRLRTDDDIYRARLVYLGPPGYTLPVQLPYAQYGLFVLLVPLYMGIHYLITLQFDPVPAWEIALAMVTTSFIWRHVDPDRPARTVIRTALTDWRGAGRAVSATEERAPRLVARRVVVREKIL